MTHWRAANNTSGRLTEGAFHQPSASRANITPRDPYPLPAHSLRPDPLMTDERRSTIAGRVAVAFLSLCFLIPLICAGVILRFQ